jgi:hypothetical protein
VPVPLVLAEVEDGRLLLEALNGTSLRARLREAASLPRRRGPRGPARLLPAALCALPRRRRGPTTCGTTPP